MPLLAHLSDRDIRRYLAGIPNLETDRHVRICVFCAERLGHEAQAALRWERRGILGRLVRVDDTRLIDQLLAEIEAERHRAA
jgi:hypothetical protein